MASTGQTALDKLLAQMATGAPATPAAPAAAPAAPATAAPLQPVPVAPTVNALDQINQAIPGFSGLSEQATQRISDLMAGKLPADVQSQIRSAGATQAQISGMPGSNMMSGTLAGNRTLRDIGKTSYEAGQQGFTDLMSMLQNYSGTVAPSANAALSAQVAREGQATEQAMQTQRLTQAATEFQQNFTLEEKKLAQQLGISEQDLALRLAALQQGKDLAYAQLNQSASQFDQGRQVSPKDVFSAAAGPTAPEGTLAALLSKYGINAEIPAVNSRIVSPILGA
ncbi:MAG: hypothetical protein ACOYD4_03905 [Solirubrobacterales bacterium]